MKTQFTSEEKAKIIQRYHRCEKAYDIYTKEGISKSTFYSWLKAWDAAQSIEEKEYAVTDSYYICAIIDLYARKVIACKSSAKQSTQLITSTFRIAYKSRQPKENLIFHSDRGTQYTSYAFQNLLKKYSIKQSFSPSGSPQHNAVMECSRTSICSQKLINFIRHSSS